MYYFTGCSHGYHWRINELCRRGFISLELMNQVLIDGINGTVGPNDTLYHLGDAVWHGYEQKFWERIRCKVILILGNHDDRKWYESMKSIGAHCPEFYDYLEIPVSVAKGKIVLSHYPIESWNGQRKGWYHFHSHTHQELPSSIGTRRYHVGVDTIGYQPLTFIQIKEKIEQRNAKTTIA